MSELRTLPIGVFLQYMGSAGSQVFVLGSQLLVFVLLARHLGDAQFGMLMAISATTQIAVGLCGLGSEEPMVRRLVRDGALYPSLLGHSLILITGSGLVLTLGSVLVLFFAVPLPRADLAVAIPIFALSNVICFRYISLTESIFIGRMEYMRANAVSVSFSLFRLVVAVIATLGFATHDLGTWALWHGLTYVGGVLGCAVALRAFGPPEWKILREEVPRGVHVATPFFLGSLRQNADTLVLSTAVPPGIVGNYGAASRIIQASLLTVWAFNRIMYPNLVQAAARGRGALIRLARLQLLAIMGIGAVTGIALYVLSPYAALLFGEGFEEMAGYLEILCWLVPLAGMQSVAYEALAAMERHGLRAALANISSVLGLGLVLWLTPAYGVSGAFTALYITQTGSLAAMWIALLWVTLGPERRP